MPNQCISEAGCPISFDSVKTQMEVDTFGTPVACRVYIDYRNGAPAPINAVRFRIGYIDAEGHVCGLFHGPDSKLLEPGAQTSSKWRGEKVSPTTKQVKLRVLMVRFADGVVWESEKMQSQPQSEPDSVI